MSSTVLELHPDELLDKDARGELTADEELRLMAHLEHCSACRLEREASRDFRMELASGESDLELESLVTRALAGAKTASLEGADEASDRSHEERTSSAPDEAAESERAPLPSKGFGGRRRRFSPMFVAAACAVFSVVGIAAAAQWTGVWHGKGQALGGAGTITNKTTATSAPPASSPLPSPPSSIVGVATQEEPALAVPSAEPVPSAAPPVVEPPKAHAPSAIAPQTAASVAALVPEVVAPAPSAPAAPPVAAPVVADAATMFAEANRAKARGNHADAVRGYRELGRTYPNSPEARLASAIVGRLLLDDGNAAEAITSLDRYLQSGDGSLREEALAARATALGRLGRHDEEIATWTQFLRSYPNSIHAKRAEARLNEAGPR